MRKARRRKKKSGSLAGLFVLEVIALVAFYFLFTQARDYREAQSAPQSLNDQPSMVLTETNAYQMYQTSPFQNLLANQSRSY